MKFLRFLWLPLLVLLWSCHDEEPALPSDSYEGAYSSFTLGDEGRGLFEGKIIIRLLAGDGTEFTREADHVREADRSQVKLSVGLREGVYRLLSATLSAPDSDDGAEFGLGSRIRVDKDGIAVIDNYNRRLGCAGSGTKDDPLIISSSSHLFNLMMAVNDYDYNKFITSETYFEQVCDIDMKSMSRSCDAEYGWMPIGADTNTPFRGVYQGGGHAVKNLIVKRPHTAGVGLFGFLYNASVDGLNMQKCSVEGQFAAGTIAGASISSGDNIRGTATITNCNLTDCTVSGPETSAMLGGVLGAIDMHSKALVADCSMSGGSVGGGMSVGGICGGAGIYSMLMVSGCENRAAVRSVESGAGGIVGSADTLMVVSSRNFANIEGPRSAGKNSAGIGVGGIAGGTGFSWITSSTNSGTVSGYEGVGGIVGSTRVKGSESEAFLYNQTLLRYCTNTGDVSGTRFVGGAVGEAQAGGFSVSNSARVSGTAYVGGIVGGSSLAVVHNAVNSGAVSADNCVGGIVGKCTWGSLAISQNAGSVTSTKGISGGIIGRAGNNTVIHYCGNFGEVVSNSGLTGGIVGDIGDPRKWTGLDIAECVIGSAECVMAFVGPVLAVAEGAVEMAHAVEVAIKIVEAGAELALQGADYCLVGFSIDEILNPEAEAELEASMKAGAEQANAENVDALNKVRAALTVELPDVFACDMTEPYSLNVRNLVDWYGVEGNDESFNDVINEKREARAGELEEIAHASEVKHTVIAGVAVVASSIAFVAGEIATGGAATALLVAGSCAAVVGGVNAIVKSCSKFEKNAVILSQCVNARRVSSDGGHFGPIAGRLCDGSIAYDCLNTSPQAGALDFAAELNKQCRISRCINLTPRTDYGCSDYVGGCAYYASKQNVGYFINDGSFFLSLGSFTSHNDLHMMDFSVGDGQTWQYGPKFPYPNKSEMQK